MDRRDFIKQGAIATAGLTILPAGSLFAQTQTTKVRLGYIGVGLRGRNHIQEGLLRDDVEIVAICDTQESSLQYCPNNLKRQAKTYLLNIPVDWMLTKSCWIVKTLMR